MTPEQQEEAKRVVRLSILIPVTPSRYSMLNNLYNELTRQIVQGGYVGKGIERWEVESPRMKDGKPVLSEYGTPIIDAFQHSFKHPDIVEIVLDKSNRSIGEKRNSLLDKALGEYLCFIDSDDWVSEDYINIVMRAIEQKPDCVSLKGVMTTDGGNPEIFEHSLKYKEWRTLKNVPQDHVKHERYPNHLNTIKSSIAKQFRFPDKNFGEDHSWSKIVYKSGLLKNEAYVSEVLYEYRFISNKIAA